MESARTGAVARLAAVFSLLVTIAFSLAGGAAAQTSSPESVVALTGNHPDEVSNLHPVAHANPGAQLNMAVTMALRNRPALDQLLHDQQNPASPRYHQWLTSAQFSSRFNPTQGDVDTVAQWLSSQGFTVTGSSVARRSVTFSGTVADAEHAFGVNIMTFGDGTSYSNVIDPAIPARFGAIISRIGGLDNFMHAIPAHPSLTSLPAAAGGWTPDRPMLLASSSSASLSERDAAVAVPDVTIGGITSFGPSDFRSFYNENPLISSGITGAGAGCIAIVGVSDFLPAAVNLFNSTFSLPASSITTVLADGADPGFNDAQDEAQLDLEWSHAVAPGAPTRYYLGNGPTSVNGPIVDSIQTAVNDNLCGVISVSFSLCGASSTFFTNTVSPIYAEMASHGQSIFISAGDFGAAGAVVSGGSCVPGSSRNINELGADPNVTHVGGTGFVPTFDAFSNNVGHVAESTWNDSVAHPADGGATGGGVSTIYSKPAYQKGSGVPADGRRDVPDVALIASDFNPGVFWGSNTGSSAVIKCCIGGTSLSAPAWAGIALLIAQLNHARPGPLNPRIYALANAGLAASGFRDVTSGNNSFNGVTGFSAGPGFDLTTGWGTVDISTFGHAFVGPPPAPHITSIPSTLLVGASFTITGSNFTPGALVNFYVSTSGGPMNEGPLTPSAHSSTALTVPIPATLSLGQGFAEVQVVNADAGFTISNLASALLQGSPVAGIPTLKSINGTGLAATSSNPAFAINNVETVIKQGTTVTLGGTGFDAAHGVAVNVFCACSGGKVPAIFVNPGSGGLTSTSFSFTLPSNVPTGPASIVVINKGADSSFSKASNAVSVPVGAALTITSVTQSGSIITVNGTGFSTLTVINFFNKQGGSSVNLGGIGSGGTAKIHLAVVNSTKFTFTKPGGAVPGPSYVQALNPPYVPFTSSGNDPGGGFTLL